MSGPPLTYNPGAVTGREAQPGDTRDAPGVLEQFGAATRVEVDKVDDVALLRRAEAYAELTDALAERGYDRQEFIDEPEILGFGLGGGIPAFDRIWRAAQREGLEGLPASQEEFDRSAYTRQGERARDQELLSRGSGVVSTVTQFGGGMTGSLADPVNAYSMLIPGAGATGSVLRKVLTDGAINAGVETYQALGAEDNYARLGEEYTFEQGVQDVALAGAGGAAFRGILEGGAAGARAIRQLDPNLPDKELARAFERMVPENLRTPEQEAVLSIMLREAEIEDGSPFVRTYEGSDTHFSRLRVAAAALEEGRLATPAEIAGAKPIGEMPVRATPRVTFGQGGRDQIKRAIAGPESGGDDFATNRAGSSAAGRYQFIEETFVGLYRQEYGVSATEAQRAWDTNRFDVGVQERLMDRLLDQNAAALERAGLPSDAGNLYLAHFAGNRKAIELLEADPSLPVASFFSRTAVRQNPTYLGGGKTVGEAIEIIRGKVGDPAQASPAPVRDVPDLRDPALDAERPSSPLAPRVIEDVGGEIAPLIDPLVDLALNTRRSLNQVDTLAEELGSTPDAVRSALQELVERGTLTQNSKTGTFMRKAAAPITPANVKRPRTLVEFLAERGGINDYAGDVQALGIRPGDKRFGAKVIRSTKEPDGLTVGSGEGDFGLDSAFRDAREAGYFPELEGMREGSYDELLDERALLLEAINEELSGSPRYRMDDWDRLGEYKLEGSTERIYGNTEAIDLEASNRAAEEAAIERFRTSWTEFGGDLADLDEELISRAAQIWANDEAFLPELALAQAVREEYELTIRAAIDEGLEAEYGEIYDPWDPEILAEADRRFAAELERTGDRPVGPFDDGPAGERATARESGEGGETDAGGRPDDRGQEALTPNQRDQLAAAKPRSDHSDLPPEPDPRFAEPDGEGIRATTESVWHDIEAQADFAAPTPEQKRAALQARTEGGIRPKGETRAAGEDGGLFDTRDTTGDLFDLGDGKGERTVADIREEIDTEKSGIEAMRSCLK